MSLASLALTFLASVATPSASPLELPPPPEGTRELAPEERDRLLETLSEEEAPEASPEVESESAELEEMRALEEAELDPDAQVSAELLQSLRRLGLGNPLRESALDAFTEPL